MPNFTFTLTTQQAQHLQDAKDIYNIAFGLSLSATQYAKRVLKEAVVETLVGKTADDARAAEYGQLESEW